MMWKERLAARKKEKEKAAAEDGTGASSPLLSKSPRAGKIGEGTLLGDTAKSLYATSPRRSPWNSALREGITKGRANKLGLVTDPSSSDRTPEVHLIGEILGGTGFGSCASCKWSVTCGDGWTCLGGSTSGHTQFDSPCGVKRSSGGTVFLACVSLAVILSVAIMVLLDSLDPVPMIVIFIVSVAICSLFLDNSVSSIGTPLEKSLVWCHPIDAHFTTTSLEGFPRIVLEVWGLDEHDCASLVAYGFCSVPMASGTYNLSCKTWRPVGTSEEEMTRAFIKAGPQLKSSSAIFDRFSDDRARLTTVGSGSVSVRLSVVLKHIPALD